MGKASMGALTIAVMVGLVAGTGFLSSPRADNQTSPKIEKTGADPFTRLDRSRGPAEFRFAVVSDRTGGHRPKIFSQSMERINLMQPDFVMSVGDLIEGYTEKQEVIDEQWREFQGYVSTLEMPFFYVPGNHDITNKTMAADYGKRFGKAYYSFRLGSALFLGLSSEDPPGAGSIGENQLEMIRKALEDNASASWTFVFLHKPLWVIDGGRSNGWAKVEELLKGRNYTVFCGHEHRYQKFIRQGMAYYQLATTGGGSRLRGIEYGEFDQIVWVTMTQKGPQIANVLVEGILPEDLHTPQSEEKGVPEPKLSAAIHPVSGTVTYNGKPVAGVDVVFQGEMVVNGRQRKIEADGRTDASGVYRLSTLKAFDGAPPLTYSVILSKVEWTLDGGRSPNQIPGVYAKAATTPLKVEVKPGENKLDFNLKD